MVCALHTLEDIHYVTKSEEGGDRMTWFKGAIIQYFEIRDG